MTLTIAPVQLSDHESIKAYVDISESVRAHDGPEWVFSVNEADDLLEQVASVVPEARVVVVD